MLVNPSSNTSIFNCGSESSLFQYRVIVEKLNDELNKFGLTSNQINVFLYLSKYGESSASTISNSLHLPRTETYQILHSLQNKGIINSQLCHPTKFSALPLNKAISILINAEKTRISTLENNGTRLENLWNKIPQFNTSKNSMSENIQMLQGSNVIFAKINEMFCTTQHTLKLFSNEKNFSRLYLEGFFDNFDISKQKLIIASKSKKFINSQSGLKNTVFCKQTESNPCFIIKDSTEILFFMRNLEYSKGEIFAFATTSQSLIQTLDLLFDNIWNKENNTLNTKRMSSNFSKFNEIMSKLDNIESEFTPEPLAYSLENSGMLI